LIAWYSTADVCVDRPVFAPRCSALCWRQPPSQRPRVPRGYVTRQRSREDLPPRSPASRVGAAAVHRSACTAHALHNRSRAAVHSVHTVGTGTGAPDPKRRPRAQHRETARARGIGVGVGGRRDFVVVHLLLLLVAASHGGRRLAHTQASDVRGTGGGRRLRAARRVPAAAAGGRPRPSPGERRRPHLPRSAAH